MAMCGMDDLPKHLITYTTDKEMYQDMDNHNRGKNHPDAYMLFFVDGKEVEAIFNSEHDVIGYQPI